MNVHPDTAEIYKGLAFLNIFGLPVDMAYFLFLNTAKDGNTQAIAQNMLVQIFAIGSLVFSALGSLVGVLTNLFSYFAFWGAPFMLIIIRMLFLENIDRAIDDFYTRTIINYLYEWGV